MESIHKLVFLLTSLCQISINISANDFEQYFNNTIENNYHTNQSVINTTTSSEIKMITSNQNLFHVGFPSIKTSVYWKWLNETKPIHVSSRIKRDALTIFPCLAPNELSTLERIFKMDPQAAILAYMELTSRNCSASCKHVVSRNQLPIKDLANLCRNKTSTISRLAKILKNINYPATFKFLEQIVYSFFKTFFEEFDYSYNYQILHKCDEDNLYIINRNSLKLVGESDHLMKHLFETLQSKPYNNDYEAVCKNSDIIEEKQSFISNTNVNSDIEKWSDLIYDCSTKRWKLCWIEPLFRCGNPNSSPLSGIIKLDVYLDDLTQDRCAVDQSNFILYHRCPPNSDCIPMKTNSSLTWKESSYSCKCSKGYYNKFNYMNNNHNNHVTGSTIDALHSMHRNDTNFIDGYMIEKLFVDKLLNRTLASNFECVPCSPSCEECIDDQPCQLYFDVLSRGAPLAMESICLTICIALFFSIFKLRKTKVMKAGIWCLIETIVVGAFLLYITVIVQYFEPTDCLCIIIQWLRELGFTFVYGSLILKVYRVLAEFQSRKAHRVQLRDKDLMKCLLCMVIVVIGYMAAWTAVNIDSSNDRYDWSMVKTNHMHGLKFELCKSAWWDYVIEIAEIIFLLFGLHLCHRARAAPANHKEIFCITFSICNEIVISSLFYVLRHILWLRMHPDHLFLMYFFRCQLTISTLLALIMGPKLWFAHQPLDELTIRNRAYSASEHEHTSPEVVKLNVNPNGDVDTGEFVMTDFNPDDIRYELKRLYTQLQIYKTKTMRQDNPHISKRRGGRKQTHRRFSLQAFHNKHKRPQNEHGGNMSSSGGAGETEVSRTPEESTNSAEGVSVYMDECSAVESNNNNYNNNNNNTNACRFFTGNTKSKRKNSNNN